VADRPLWISRGVLYLNKTKMGILSFFQRRKNKKAFKDAMGIISALKSLQDLNVIKLDRGYREVWLLTDVFWNGNSDEWKKNMCKNLHMYMNVHLPEVSQDDLNMPLGFYEMDISSRKKVRKIAVYWPENEITELL
jgi:hypothetical protein